MLALTLALAACTKGGGHEPSGPPDSGAADLGADAASDAGMADLGRTCRASSECDDGIACTLDSCGTAGTCRHLPESSLCEEGRTCVEGVGCTHSSMRTCTVDEDCDDGIFCNGDARCAGRVCLPLGPRTCDDGNACTIDVCDPVLDRCVRELAPGCDGGVLEVDLGARPFDPAIDYTGRFLLAPAQSSGCGAATYSISSVTFSTTAGALTVQAGTFPLRQSPPPAGASFDAAYEQSGCGTYRLAGTFSDANTFSGTWTATFSGACSLCPGQFATVTGVRAP
jgi:hypothetical protein